MTRTVFKAAVVSSIPVMMGYLAMGMAAGILLAGETGLRYAPLWAFFTSMTSISGALQFLMVGWIRNGTPLTEICLLTVCLNIRYAMYGLSLIERFRKVRFLRKLYLVWTLTDETYALEVENKTPPGEDSVSYCTTLAFLDHAYWIIGVTAGAFAGQTLPFCSKGIDFAMTALFLVILTDQCREKANRLPAAAGTLAAVAAWGIFGQPRMLIPAMGLILCILLALRRKIDPARARKEAR